MFLLVVASFATCAQSTSVNFHPSDNAKIRYRGRVDLQNPKEPILITSASFMEWKFKGDQCAIKLRIGADGGNYEFISMEVDGKYVRRLKIDTPDFQWYDVPIAGATQQHIVRIFKATEAQNGSVIIGGVRGGALLDLDPLPNQRIEFIGNSITCGMGNDLSDIPCGEGEWYDQHNAYWAYGPIAARKLGVDFMLSSVSGIGMYRNWNGLFPVMPEVYENKYLNTDTTLRWDFTSFIPDVVSICLGTNDLSLGDGKTERLPFDSAAYVTAYIEFANLVYEKYPQTSICLLSSPMVNGASRKVLESCLRAVQEYFQNVKEPKEIDVFYFPEMSPHGCTYHPDVEDHKMMASLLTPFYQKLLSKVTTKK